MTEELKERLIDLCLDGLCYDGGHHKQYYLEQILRLITTEEEFQDLFIVKGEGGEEYEQWEPGIP